MSVSKAVDEFAPARAAATLDENDSEAELGYAYLRARLSRE